MSLRTLSLLCLVLFVSGCGGSDEEKAAPQEQAADTSTPAVADSDSGASESGQADPDGPAVTQSIPDDPDVPGSDKAADPGGAVPSLEDSPPVAITTDPPVVSAEPKPKSPGVVPTSPSTSPGGTALPAEEIDLSYIDSTFVAGFVARPHQILKSRLVRTAVDAGFEGDEYESAMKEFSQNFGVPLADVKQVAVLVSQRSLARMSGMQLPEEGGAVNSVQLKNQLKMIGLAFHNYHDVNNSFPSATGELSWRVHLLPYLEQQALYEKFALDEPWDSETNKPLIEQMPNVFKAPGVDEEGETSIHVFVGENAPFEQAVGLRNVVDGTSNTILTALAAADTAEAWTKPGGLKINKEDPWDSFGDIGDGPVLIGMMDGSVTDLSQKLDAEAVVALMTHAGLEPVDRAFRGGGPTGPDPEENPTLIAHFNSAIDKETAVEMIGQGFDEPQEKKGNGQTYYDVGGYALWFPNDKTMVATQTKLLPRLMANHQDDSKLRRILKASGSSDFVGVADPEAMPRVFNGMMEGAPVPAIAEITSVTQILDVSAATRPLFRLEVIVSNEQSATGLLAMANGTLAMGKMQLSPENAPPGMAPFLETLQGVIKDVEVQQDGTKLFFEVPKPQNYDQVIDAMKPQFQGLGAAVRGARGAAKRAQNQNQMKQIGIAFHNHHDVFKSFGAADGSTPNGRKGGLSWRVHLLPFLEATELYERFKLDEPWDSEHNKKLIAEMPDVFKVEGVDEPGKTSMHVFVGEGAPFGDGKTAVSFRDIVDGSSNTILVVQAGADVADVWTKPGGLEVDAEKPLAALGAIGDLFVVLMADGSVHNISKTIDGDVLRNMISHEDGNPIEALGR